MEILTYLQQLIPPVIHRDIKPENIIYSDDGKVSLVDFGAVQDVYHQTVMGSSTVVGTYGYMAPEQFRGQAVLSTDLYGLGTTLIYLLTGKFPSDLPQRHLKINFQPYVNIDRKFSKWLKRMIEPIAEDRFLSAVEALAILQGEQPFHTTTVSQKPQFATITKISHINDGEGIIIDSPAVWFGAIESCTYALFGTSLFGLSYWFTSFIINQKNYFSIPLAPIIWLYPIVFFNLGLLIAIFFIKEATVRTRIKIERDDFYLKQWLLGYCYREISGKIYDMSIWQLKKSEGSFSLKINGELITTCTFRVKGKKHSFGILLSEAEKKWIVAEVNVVLQEFDMS